MLAALTLAATACGNDDTPPPVTQAPSVTEAPPLGGPFGPGVTQTEIRLGMTNDLAGVGDTPFGVITVAVSAYLRKANEEDGGVCGRDVLLLTEDDQHSPELAMEKTKKLVEQDQVLALVGAVDTAIHAPVAAYLNDPNADGAITDGVPDLFLSTGWSGWGDVARLPWTVGFAPDYQTDARAQTAYINEQLGDKKIGVLYQADGYGLDYNVALETTLTSRERLVSQQAFDPGAGDLRANVVALRDAGAEAVLLALSPSATAEAIKSAGTETYAPRWFISYANSPSSLAREIGGGVQPEQLAAGFQLLNGAISTTYLISTIEDIEAPAMLEHKRIMESYGGPEAITTLSAYGQSLGELTIEALSAACDNLTREGLLRAAESVRGFQPSLFARGIDVGLGPADHYAVQALQLVQVQADGTLAELGDPVSYEVSKPDGPAGTPAVFP